MRSEAGSRGVIYEYKVGGEDAPEEMARHAYYEIYYLTRGSELYLVGNKSYELDEGDILLIPEGLEHKTIEADENRQRYSILCRPQFIPGSARETLGERATVIRPLHSGDAIDEIISRIAKESTASDIHREDALRFLVGELMIMLARCENTYVQSEDNSPAVATAIAYIKEHYSDRISLPDVAETCKVSSAYLSRRFKDEVGIGFSDYLSRFRLRHAAAMLKERPEASITEVAFACGFNDSNYFSDKFKKQYGVSPLRFKKE